MPRRSSRTRIATIKTAEREKLLQELKNRRALKVKSNIPDVKIEATSGVRYSIRINEGIERKERVAQWLSNTKPRTRNTPPRASIKSSVESSSTDTENDEDDEDERGDQNFNDETISYRPGRDKFGGSVFSNDSRLNDGNSDYSHDSFIVGDDETISEDHDTNEDDPIAYMRTGGLKRNRVIFKTFNLDNQPVVLTQEHKVKRKQVISDTDDLDSEPGVRTNTRASKRKGVMGDTDSTSSLSIYVSSSSSLSPSESLTPTKITTYRIPRKRATRIILDSEDETTTPNPSTCHPSDASSKTSTRSSRSSGLFVSSHPPSPGSPILLTDPDFALDQLREMMCLVSRSSRRSGRTKVFVIPEEVVGDWDVEGVLEEAERSGVGKKIGGQESGDGGMVGWEIWIFGN